MSAVLLCRRVALAAAFSALALTAGCTDKDLSDVAQASADWDAAFNSGDVAKLGERYEDVAVSMPPGASQLMGRAAIQADFAAFFAKNRGEHHTLAPSRFVDRDTAVERASYQMIITPKDGSPPTVERGKHIVVYHRQKDGGGWKVFEEIWNAGQ